MAELEQIKGKLQEAFDAVDTDGDGKISPDDLKAALEKAGLKVSDDDAAAVIAAADKDGTGSIGFEEFCEGVLILGVKIRIVVALKEAFEAMDTDNTGTLNADQIKAGCASVGISEHVSDDQIDGFIAKADKDGSGSVNLEEFLEAFLE